MEATDFEVTEERAVEDVEEIESENERVVEVVVKETKCTNSSNNSNDSNNSSNSSNSNNSNSFNEEHESVRCPEELRNLIMSRLKANIYARSEVRRYCALTGVFLCGDERKHIEERAKYQFYLDSRCETLVNEALEWAGANPGCLPFRVGEVGNG